jgi:hypothetical protein
MDNNRGNNDDNWAENTTVVTGNTSEHSYCEDSNRAMPYRLAAEQVSKYYLYPVDLFCRNH